MQERECDGDAVCLGIWLIAMLIFCITEIQFKKYRTIHEHDLAMISESIETFTGFIDTKIADIFLKLIKNGTV